MKMKVPIKNPCPSNADWEVGISYPEKSEIVSQGKKHKKMVIK